MGNGKKVKIEAIENCRLLLKARCYLDLNETFVVPSFRQNLISVFALDKYVYSFLFRNEKFSVFYDSKLVGSDSLLGNNNIYLLDTIASFNESYN